jgi:hypothetical protein
MIVSGQHRKHVMPLNGQRREPIAHFLAYWSAQGRARCGARPDDQRCCGAGLGSELGQTEKNSLRANVFRFALELGHQVMMSALRICARTRLVQRSSDTRFG